MKVKVLPPRGASAGAEAFRGHPERSQGHDPGAAFPAEGVKAGGEHRGDPATSLGRIGVGFTGSQPPWTWLSLQWGLSGSRMGQHPGGGMRAGSWGEFHQHQSLCTSK